jgi:hypothetical protein
MQRFSDYFDLYRFLMEPESAPCQLPQTKDGKSPPVLRSKKVLTNQHLSFYYLFMLILVDGMADIRDFTTAEEEGSCRQ